MTTSFRRSHKGPEPLDPDVRFWRCVAIGPPDACWEWTGGRYRNGYGAFAYGSRVDAGPNSSRKVLAHRYAFASRNGAPRKGMVIAHKCDNRACCNPDHLFEATHKENTQDAVSKGRLTRGSRQHMARFHETQVYCMRIFAGAGVPRALLRRMFGATREHSCYILKPNKHWKHVQVPVFGA